MAWWGSLCLVLELELLYFSSRHQAAWHVAVVLGESLAPWLFGFLVKDVPCINIVTY